MRSVSVIAGLVGRLCSQDTSDHPSRRTRTGEEGFLGLLQGGDRLFLRDGWKVLEKVRETLTALDVVEQGLERHARPHEYRSPIHDVGIAVHGRLLGCAHVYGHSILPAAAWMRRRAADCGIVVAVPAATPSRRMRISVAHTASASLSTSVSRLLLCSSANGARSSWD